MHLAATEPPATASHRSRALMCSAQDEVKSQLVSAGVRYERAPAVDGMLLTKSELQANVTALGRALMTRGMIGCFLSHRKCWQRCADANGGPMIVFEDDGLATAEDSKWKGAASSAPVPALDQCPSRPLTRPRACASARAVVLADNFTAVLSEAMADLPDDWDVLLLGALGAVHPKYYGLNLMHAMMAGGMHWPRWVSPSIHTPLRPFGTHAYVISARGAKKLLAAAPRASYHVDVVAWGLRQLRLFAVHPLIAKQTHGDTTIGALNPLEAPLRRAN